MNEKIECYWVGSNGENPERIYFNAGDAMDSDHYYMDSFDGDGNHIQAYLIVNGVWVTDF